MSGNPFYINTYLALFIIALRLFRNNSIERARSVISSFTFLVSISMGLFQWGYFNAVI